MIECKSLSEAQMVENAIHIHREADDLWVAYQKGDDVPPNLHGDSREPAVEDRIAKAKTLIAEAEALLR